MRTVDIHAHWYPQEWIRVFEKDGAKEGASIERRDGKYFLKVKHITNAFDERFVVHVILLLGQLKSRLERHQRADECLDGLVQDNPQSAAAFLGRHAYRAKYRLPEAVDDLQAAIALVRGLKVEQPLQYVNFRD